MAEPAQIRRYSGAVGDPEPRWIASGTATTTDWRLGIGDETTDGIDLVLEVTSERWRDLGGRATSYGPVLFRPEDRMFWAISGPFSQDPADGLNDQYFYGATHKGAAAVEIEFDNGSRRSARLVRCTDVRFDVYLVPFGVDDAPTAKLRVSEEDGVIQRIELPPGL